MRLALIQRMLEARAAGEPVALVTDLATGWQSLARQPAGPAPGPDPESSLEPAGLEPAGLELAGLLVHGDFGLEPWQAQAVRALLRSGESRLLRGPEHTGPAAPEPDEEAPELFVRVYAAPSSP